MLFDFLIATLIVAVSVPQYGNGSRILGIFPAASISHQIVFRALTLALNKRGHELVVVTPSPVNDSTLNNYTEIDVSFIFDTIFRGVNFVNLRPTAQWVDFFIDLAPMFQTHSDEILSRPELRNLYAPNSNEKFDLILMEMLYWPAFLPLAKRFEVPIVGITSLGLSLNVQYWIGSPIFSSHLSNWELGTHVSGSLTFWQRVNNFFKVWKYLHYFTTVYMPEQEVIARKHFGNDIPALHDIQRNVSLVLVNQQGPISYARPHLPNIIEIGGLHISKQIDPLDKDLKEMLDKATEGFVYMSLGTNAKSTMLSKETINEFITAFSRLPYKVLWKFEDDFLPGKPENVHIMKWVPQQAVLAHPNLKVFVYQGGLQSTEEAVTHAVPLVGFPILADQEMQVTKMASIGVAIKLEITAVDGNELYEAITNVAMDSSFKERMLNLRSLIKDKPHDPLENAVWWTEFVIRHRGAPHLQSITADEPWYSGQDMDIIAFICAGFLIVISLTLFILYQCLVYSIHAFTNRSVVKKQKQN